MKSIKSQNYEFYIDPMSLGLLRCARNDGMTTKQSQQTRMDGFVKLAMTA